MPSKNRVVPQRTRDRFMSKCDRSGGPEACWPWTGGDDPAPVSTPFFGRLTITRAAWLLANGSLPRKGLIVVRRCSTANCANVLHMGLGTRRDRVLPERAAWRGREAEVLAVRAQHPPYEAAMLLGITSREVARCILHLSKLAKAPNTAAFLRQARRRAAQSSRAPRPPRSAAASAGPSESA